MARTLKNTGIAANVVWLLGVDDDGTTIKEFKNGWTPGSGLTLTGATAAATDSWKGTACPVIDIPNGGALTIASAPAVSSPFCLFYLARASGAVNGVYAVLASATANGATDGGSSGPVVVFNSTPQPVLRPQGGGGALAAPNVTLSASGNNYSVFLNEALNGSNNDTFYAAEASGSTSLTNTVADPGVDFTNAFPKQISGTDWITKIVLFGCLNTLMDNATASAIHADPFGTFFAGPGGSKQLMMLGAG